MKTITITFRTPFIVLLPIAIFAQFAVTAQSSTGAGSGVSESTNVAQGKAATASSTDNASHSAMYAVDGDEGTRFSSGYSDNQWLSVDLGKAYLISSIMLIWEQSYGKDFDILFSNNGSYTDLYIDSIQVRNHILTDSIVAGVDAIEAKQGTTARYVRIQGIHRATNNGYSIWEMQVMGITASTTLFPVSVTGFTASPVNSSSALEWTTVTEYSNAGFSIERSNDAMNFSPIGWVAARNAGTVISHYSFTDKQPAAGKNYYRLKQIWQDGKTGYSPVITVMVAVSSSSINVYPVPAKDHFLVEYKGNAGESISIELFNTYGLPVYKTKVVAQGTQQSMTINRTGTMLAGEYFLSISSADNKKYNKKIVLQ